MYFKDHPLLKEGERKPDAQGKGPQYKFLAWDDVADEVGYALALHGIDFRATQEELSREDNTTPGGSATSRWTTRLRLRLVNCDKPDDFDEFTWTSGCDDKETATGVSKATTYTVKDALLKRLLLSGDPSDQQQVSENGSAASFASGVAGGIVCPKCQVGKVVQKQGKGGPWIGCSNWKPNDKGCDWKQWGTTIQDWLDKTQEQERQREPDPEAPFVADQDGTPRAQTRGEVEAATSGPVHSPAVAKIMALWSERDDAGRLVRPREQAREVILQNGGMSALKMPTEPDGQWLLRPSALEALKLPVLAKIQGVLEGIVVTAGLPLSPAVAFDRAVTGDHD
jgi:hypothetical protein